MRIADQKRADFVKRFRGLSRRFPLWQVWSDFITMFAVALSNAVDSRYRTEREAMYKRIIEKYDIIQTYIKKQQNTEKFSRNLLTK